MSITPELLAKAGTEASHMKALFCWSALNYKLYPQLNFLAHVPNGGNRDAREGASLKAQGVKSGVPDIVMPFPKNKNAGLWIELKIEKIRNSLNGGLSDNQIIWIDYLSSVGYCAKVCYGWIEARDTLINYLEGRL